LDANLGAMHGTSFRRVLEGDADEHRPAIVTGYHEGMDRCVRPKEWSYFERPDGEPDELYRLADDPREQPNLIEAHPEEAQRLARLFGRYFRARRRRFAGGIQGKYERAASGLEEPVLGPD
jgi:hypothetical protein